jgi:chromosome partitioning protein
MQSIMVFNSKVGLGKSTVSTNLVSYFALQCEKMVFVGFDSQFYSLEGLANRPCGGNLITGIDASKGIFRAPRKVDYINYDTPAAILANDITHYLRRAQSVIIPVLLAPIDMRAATLFIQNVLSNGRVIRKQCRVALIANRCKENTNLFQQLGIYIKKVRKTPFLSALREIQNYNNATEKGQGIFELLPCLVGRDLGQWERIINWLMSKRSQLEN